MPRFWGLMKSPAFAVVGTLKAVARNIVMMLQAYVKKLEEVEFNKWFYGWQYGKLMFVCQFDSIFLEFVEMEFCKSSFLEIFDN